MIRSCIVYCGILTRNSWLVRVMVFLSHILVWRPSPRTSLSRRCMNSELEVLDKEGEEGGEEVVDMDEEADDMEKEEEGEGDTFEGRGEEEWGRMKEL